MSTAKRLNRACDACARRKVRCDRNRPCNPCLQRNIGRYCSNYSLSRKHPIGSRDNLTKAGDANHISETQVALLRERLAVIEEQLAQSQDNYISTDQSTLDSNQEGSDDRASRQPLRDLDALHVALESLNLGLNGSQPAVTDYSDTLQDELDVHTLLPSYETSTEIVRFSLQHLSWIHCALRSSDFLQKHEDFWTAILSNHVLEDSRGQWLTLYFAVISSGFYYMDTDHRCFTTFSFHHPNTDLIIPHEPEDAIALSQIWYRTALSRLERADFLGRAKLNTVQTIAVLTLVHNSFGEHEREWNMMGIAINMARTLNMHMLGAETTYEPNLQKRNEWNMPENRALGRRLWWTFIICDWLGSMKNFPSISPDSFDSKLDVNSYDEDVVLSPGIHVDSSGLKTSCLVYHKIMANLADVLRTYVKAGRGASEANLAKAMTEVEKISLELPVHLQRGEPESSFTLTRDQRNPWIPMQRYLITHVLQSIRLTIARAFLDRWLHRQPDKEGFHSKAILAAEIIVSEKLRHLPLMYQKSWIVCAATMAAGVFLGLDLLCFGTGEGEIHITRRKEAIQVCIDALKSLGPINVIARRGPSVLQNLLQLESTWDYKTVPDRNKFRQIVDYISSKVENSSDSNVTTLSLPSTISRDVPDNTAHLTIDGESGFSAHGDQNDPFDEILANAVFDHIEFEMETFENPFGFTDSML